MRIGINGQKLLINEPAGPEKFTSHLIEALAKIDRENQYVIYLSDQRRPNFFKTLTAANPNFTFKTVNKRLSWTQTDLALELVKNPVDVLFSAVHTIPMVSMIHGLEYTYAKASGLTEWYVAAFSDAVIVPTAAVKQAIALKKWPLVDTNKIKVINEGVDDSFYKRTAGEVALIKEKYGLAPDAKYLFFISTIQPRKNIPIMIEGFSRALKENPELRAVKLLIAGKKGWDVEPAFEAPKKFGVEKNVAFLGRVPDEDVPALLSGAAAYISCSLEEGFGLTLLEAMACETPCVVSDIPAFHEVGGDFPIFVAPKSAAAISNAIAKTLNGRLANVTNENLVLSKKRAETFSWEKTAQQTLAVIKSVLD
jgi:glycosyltransferase involved in cell wall biosynthesis